MQRVLAVALTSWLAVAGRAGDVPQEQKSDAPTRLRTRSELVVVPVTVKDGRGNLVGGLERGDFRVLEDGAEQQIALFSSDAFPLSAVILIDNNLSLKPASQVQKSLVSITAGFGPSDEAAISLYDEYPSTILDFSADKDQIFAKLKRMQLGSSFPGENNGPLTSGPLINGQSDAPQVRTGVTKSGAVTKNLDDAIYASAEMLRNRGHDRRKIIFLISDGSNSHHNQRSFDQTRQLLLSADISVYAISVGNALLKHESSRLLKYANETGGDAFYATKQRDLERLYSILTEEARTQYTLAFVPPKSDPSRDYHSIEVRVERPNLHILARQGFYSATSR